MQTIGVTMMNKVAGLFVGLGMVGASGLLLAAPPADWKSVNATEITLFYPGASSMEWIVGDIRIDRVRHGGGRAFTKSGDTCVGCHADEAKQMGELMASGKKLEPNPVAGRVGSIPIAVQAAHDGESLFMRLSWKQPANAGLAKLDEQNPIKVAFMLDADKVETANQSGCWASCHADSKTMPDGSDSKTKYVKGGSLDAGVYYDLIQWRSGENKAYNGYVADQRVQDASSAIVADGKLEGDTWTVVFQRKLAGGKGDVTLVPGKTYNIGFAIHNEHAAGRYHHVSLGYTLGLDTKADILAAKQ
jgi:hypothetical protein